MSLPSFPWNSPKYSPENTVYATVTNTRQSIADSTRNLQQYIGYICSYEVFYLLKIICVSLPVDLVSNL